MNQPRIRVLRAELSELRSLVCPSCQERLSLELRMKARGGWRRLLPRGRRPLLACPACAAILDATLPRGSRILRIETGPTSPLSPAVFPPREAGPTPVTVPGIELEPEADIMAYRKRIRGDAPMTPEQTLFRERVLRALHRSDLEVPVLPRAAAELSRLFRSSEVSVGRVIEVIEQDPALTAMLLRMSNSPLYRGDRPCDSLQDAVGRLGFSQVQGLAWAVTLSGKVLSMNGYGIDARSLNRHAIGVAFLAQRVAERCGIDPGQAFMAGILHDLGKVLILGVCRGIERELKVVDAGRVVHELIDLHHARLGGVLCVRWKLPDFLRDALHHHHDPPRDVCRLAAALNLADALAHYLGLGTPPVRLRITGHPALPALGLGPVDIMSILDAFEHVRADYETLAA